MAKTQPRLNTQSFSTNYITQCKICGWGIYGHQPYQWAQKPLGLSHTECIETERK